MKKLLAIGLGLGILSGVSACSIEPRMSEADVAFVNRLQGFGYKKNKDVMGALEFGQRVCGDLRSSDDPASRLAEYEQLLRDMGFGTVDRTLVMHATFQNLCTEFQPIAGKFKDARLPEGW
ncbi:hypothetical protein AUR04nite_00390 [Glutamicibacter uratoxydans]|uniref:DUF732 domain-containing protein n=1 Tax=Glutamicibacter uratoxydans TaxID=43667 RepID=A0A4Y4DIQ6_GLUUR|nr:DUF732 domain-containing protein [Glutamicibacter uratoxydans]GED04507.1 hypothetical protein AUR04nite_00390 [Glutamicibacter uratoxydans]